MIIKTCHIYFETLGVDIYKTSNIWKKFNENITDEIKIYDIDDVIRSFSPKFISEHIELRTCLGSVVKINGKIFIVNCYHIDGLHNFNIYTYLVDVNGVNRKIMLKIRYVMSEFDLMILEFENEIQELDFTILEFENEIQELDFSKSLIKLDQISAYVSTKSSNIKLLDHDFDIVFVGIEHDYIRSFIISKLPIIKFRIKDFDAEHVNIYGLSGSLLTIGSMIAGMVYGYSENDNLFEAIPVVVLKIIINGIICNVVKDISCFQYDTQLVDIDIYEDGNITYGYQILDDQIFARHNTNKKTIFKFKPNDYIVGVNNSTFDCHGQVYMDELGTLVSLNTYVMLNAFIGKFVKFKIIREQQQTINISEINIQPNFCKDVYNINTLDKHKYICWNGFMFTELSEELIIGMTKNGQQLNGMFFENYRKIIDENRKFVVLLDIDSQILDKDTYQRLKTPCILERITKNKINSLDDVNKLLTSSQNNKNSITLVFKNRSHHDIKHDTKHDIKCDAENDGEIKIKLKNQFLYRT